MPNRKIDMVGAKIGRWTVLAPAETRDARAYWLCRCECGTKREVAGYSLRIGGSLGCGCYRGDPETTAAWREQIRTEQRQRTERVLTAQKREDLLFAERPFCSVLQPLTYDGQTRTVGQWSEKYLIPPHVLLRRLQMGWSTGEALLEPIYMGDKYKRGE